MNVNPVYEELADGRTCRLVREYRRTVVLGKRIYRIVIPVGFEWDRASVPRIFWLSIGQVGRFNRAALVHDWLYYTGIYPRAIADSIFLALMAEDGVGWWKRNKMYWGVRLGARKAWAWHREQGHRAGDFDEPLKASTLMKEKRLHYARMTA